VRGHKTGLIICSYFILRFEKTQLEKWGGGGLEPSSLIEVYAYGPVTL